MSGVAREIPGEDIPGGKKAYPPLLGWTRRYHILCDEWPDPAGETGEVILFDALRGYADATCELRARRPLTDGQIREIASRTVAEKLPAGICREFARAIERAHGIGESGVLP